MGDYRQYVDFEVPPRVVMAMRGMTPPGDPDDAVLKGADRIKMEMALAEIAATPEGEKLLRDAAAKSPEGRVHILANGEGGFTKAFTSTILLGSGDGAFRYKEAGSETRHDDFLQNMIVHELTHIGRSHAEQVRPDEDSDGVSLSEEAEAVREANAYIGKYYGAKPRDENTKQIVDMGGTKEWDYNTARLAESLKKMTPEQVKAAGPEVQSLHEFRNDPRRLAQQVNEMANDGSLERGKDEILKLIRESEAPAPKWADAGIWYQKPLQAPTL